MLVTITARWTGSRSAPFALRRQTSAWENSPREMLPQAALYAVSKASRSSLAGFFFCARCPFPDHSNCASTAAELIRKSYSSFSALLAASSRYIFAAFSKSSARYAWMGISHNPPHFAISCLPLGRADGLSPALHHALLGLQQPLLAFPTGIMRIHIRTTPSLSIPAEHP